MYAGLLAAMLTQYRLGVVRAQLDLLTSYFQERASV